MESFKIDLRRNLAVEKRDIYGLDAADMIQIRTISRCFLKVAKAIRVVKRKDGFNNAMKKNRLLKLFRLLLQELRSIFLIENVPNQRRHPKHPSVTVYDIDPHVFSQHFRFRSPESILELIRGFRLPDLIRVNGYKFTAQEVVMISLARLAYPLRWCDVLLLFPGRKRWSCQRAFYWFLDFMIKNWGYLILNNRDFWVPYFQQSADAIRVKLSELPNESYRLFYPPADQPGGFSVFGFIDNTMLAMCRPGGGPIQGGEQSARVDKLVQQAWWTGWKKLHGLKFQTVVMANGMDFEVWGPTSVRHNDNYTLAKSNIIEKLRQCQLGNQFQYKIFGDSAYFDNPYLATGGGRGMASVRETVEWEYKDVKTYWKYCDYRHCLKMKRQPLAKIFFVALLLRNAHCCFYGCEAAGYFNFLPPTFDDWISQGPTARPIPADSVFSENWNGENAEEDEDSDEEN
jgi:hypothetical protein